MIFQKLLHAEEVNRLIPQLEGTLERISEIKREAWAKMLELEGLLTSPALVEGDPKKLETFLRVKHELAFILEQLNVEVENIQLLGCDLNDVDQGLVDFPPAILGKEALPCWHPGEEKVGYWHGLDEGFPGRKPLDNFLDSVNGDAESFAENLLDLLSNSSWESRKVRRLDH